MIQEMKRPIKNDLEIFGLRGSKKAEQSKIAERKDLKIVGYSSIKNKINEESTKIETSIPTKSIRIKVPSIFCQASCNFLFLTKFTIEKSNAWMALMSLSYTPKIKATVPPEIPGITSATPIAIPLKNKVVLFSLLFMKLLLSVKVQIKPLLIFLLRIYLLRLFLLK